ncbi:hypothetical protein L7F22_054009 [Adiantum nelumboides]|nr:hypothetical protein [Adiantum nelumboides]
MKIQQSVVLTLVAILASFCSLVLSQKASGGGTASKYRNASKQSSNNIVQLRNQDDFESLVSAQRDYSVSLLLSAIDSPPVQCGPCKIFQPIYEQIAKGLRKSTQKDATNQHIFAYLEFKNGREVFQKLNLQYAPVLLFFPATVGPRASAKKEPDQYDFNRLGFEGEDVAKDISQKIGIRVPYSKPFPWQLVGIATAGSGALILLLFVILPRLSRAIGGSGTNPDGTSAGITTGLITGFIFKALVLAFITIMCAGHMWNGIRNAPYITTDGAGKPQYFAAGFQNQNAAETQIVAVIYGILGFSIVSLTVLVPTQRDPVKQRAGVYVWSAILLSAFSLLLYVFRLKNASYPFRFLF